MRGSLSKRVAVVAILTALVAGSVAGPAGAYHRERQAELSQLMAKKRAQLSSLHGREGDVLAALSASTQRQAAAETRLASIDAELRAARVELKAIEKRLDNVIVELQRKTAELELTQGDLEERTQILDNRVRQIWMGASEPYAELLDVAKSFDDVVSGSEYLNRVVRSDRQILDEIEAIKAQLLFQASEIEIRKESLRIDRASARATEQEIVSKRRARLLTAREIRIEVTLQKQLLGQIRARRSNAARVLARFERESREIEAFLQGSQSGQSIIQGRGGWLRYPVSGSVTSPYGWRTHPITGERSFHTGIDIGASSGTTVRSARIGEVIYAGYYGAYGLTVIVDHGSSVATLYAHLSRTYVSVGEHVGTLESIAAVGSTGWSTGPHLHWEVRVQGSHSNPSEWT